MFLSPSMRRHREELRKYCILEALFWPLPSWPILTPDFPKYGQKPCLNLHLWVEIKNKCNKTQILLWYWVKWKGQRVKRVPSAAVWSDNRAVRRWLSDTAMVHRFKNTDPRFPPWPFSLSKGESEQTYKSQMVVPALNFFVDHRLKWGVLRWKALKYLTAWVDVQRKVTLWRREKRNWPLPRCLWMIVVCWGKEIK